MTVNQLFKNKPSLEFILKILDIIGVKSLEHNSTFRKNDLKDSVINKINNIKFEFLEYYIPCKYNIYFTNLDNKKLITILRQMVKIYNFKIISKDTHFKGDKITTYIFKLVNEKKETNLSIKNKYTIVFD
tara:strand:+ start:6027 stop:6416 length:390 start_codon:yes stop_codon:yes gene_type:complete